MHVSQQIYPCLENSCCLAAALVVLVSLQLIWDAHIHHSHRNTRKQGFPKAGTACSYKAKKHISSSFQILILIKIHKSSTEAWNISTKNKILKRSLGNYLQYSLYCVIWRSNTERMKDDFALTIFMFQGLGSSGRIGILKEVRKSK